MYKNNIYPYVMLHTSHTLTACRFYINRTKYSTGDGSNTACSACALLIIDCMQIDEGKQKHCIVAS